MFFSPSTRGFYAPGIHDTVPEDAVELTDEAYRDLLAAQAAGGTIGSDEDGRPVAVLPPVPSAAEVLAQAKGQAQAAMHRWLAAFYATFTGGLPPEEVTSWPTKAEAARQHLGGSVSAMIVAEAQATGEDPDDLAATIVARADAYTEIVAAMTGIRRAGTSAITAATSPGAVEAALDDFLADASAFAASITPT